MIISNCVINLSTDKDKVLARGVPRAPVGWPARRLRRRRPTRASCIGEEVDGAGGADAWLGALLESEYVAKLRAAGFTDVEVEPTRIYTRDDAAEMASSCCGAETEAALRALDGAMMSAFIRAKKP